MSIDVRNNVGAPKLLKLELQLGTSFEIRVGGPFSTLQTIHRPCIAAHFDQSSYTQNLVLACFLPSLVSSCFISTKHTLPRTCFF